MKISDRYKLRERVAEDRVRRVQLAMDRMKENDLLKLSLAQLPDGDATFAPENFAEKVLNAAYDPVGQLIDTLKNKGFKQAEIRATVANLYGLYFGYSDPKAATKTYEEQLEPVALYVYEHQEIYNTLNPADLRE